MTVYFAEVERFRTWCKDNWLNLNVMKTKDNMLIDSIKNPSVIPNLFLDCERVERMADYK